MGENKKLKYFYKVNFKIIFVLIFSTAILGCDFLADSNNSENCIDNNCDAKMVFNYPQDSSGYYHIKLSWTSPYYPRFNLYCEAKKYLIDGRDDLSIISATFDTDTYWVLGDSVAFIVPLYNPFQSLYTNPYWNHPLPFRQDTIILNQFEGLLVPVVQKDTRIYFKEYFEGNLYRPADEYKPTDPEKYLWSKRIVGPISPSLKGDTATIFMQVSWVNLPNQNSNIYSAKVIFE